MAYIDVELLKSNVERLANQRGESRTKALIDSGVGKDFFSNFNKGQIPSIEKIVSLADYFDVSVDYLLGRTDSVNVIRKETTLENNIATPEDDISKIIDMIQELPLLERSKIIVMIDEMRHKSKMKESFNFMENNYKCLFRFEDSFEPTGKADKKNLNESILRHINGEESSFYSYGRHLIPCMAKYYHYPNDTENVSLYVHTDVIVDNSYNVGGFNSYKEAKKYFNSPMFPENYPSIQDGEVLMENKLTNGTTFKFGYDVYFLVLLTILVCKDGNSFGKYFHSALKVINKFYAQLSEFRIISALNSNSVSIAMDLLSFYYKYDRYYCTIAEIVNMPIWATTFPEEKKRNAWLAKMYNELLVVLDKRG